MSFFLEGVAAASADAERSIIDVASLITADRNRLLTSPKAGPDQLQPVRTATDDAALQRRARSPAAGDDVSYRERRRQAAGGSRHIGRAHRTEEEPRPRLPGLCGPAFSDRLRRPADSDDVLAAKADMAARRHPAARHQHPCWQPAGRPWTWCRDALPPCDKW